LADEEMPESEPGALGEAAPAAGEMEPAGRDRAANGGRAVVEKYGKEHMAAIGRKGSRAVVKKYGLRFYSEIAARNKGVKKGRRRGPEPAT
jgi:hypothetical protein